MSNVNQNAIQPCEFENKCGAFDLLIKPKDKDLGGFSVRRSLPTIERKMVGPWIFFDEMGPATFPAGQGINVRPHPHVNIATVTYLFEGEILHRDSIGSYQTIQPGDVNLMVTGSGMTHSERERPEVTQVEHKLHGLQLWLALPAKDEETAPAFYHYPSASIPKVDTNAFSARVIIGEAFGVCSPVKTFANTLYVEASLKKGQSITLPNAQERAVYVVSGTLSAKGSNIPMRSMAVFSAEQDIELSATEDTRLAIIGGENIGKRFIEWNFVSSRKARIEQAKTDWKNGDFPKVKDDELEFIPLP
jgi:redox-sensitive bicupin YhaK (pirin superfamily)